MKNSEYNHNTEVERANYALECERLSMDHGITGDVAKAAYWKARADRLRKPRSKKPKLHTSPHTQDRHAQARR